MFEYCENLEEVNMDNFDVRKVTDMSYAFYHTKVKTIDFFAFKTENLEFCSNLFDSSDGLKAVDLSKWNTPKNSSGGCGQVVAHTTSVRFLDVSNLRMLSSNEIAFNKNLSILRLSGKYDSISTSLGNYDYYWYNIDNNTLYRHAFNNDPFYNHLKTLQDWEPATYIRPDNNPTPSVFNNKYIVPVEENITINIRENENTKLSDIFPKLLTTDEDIEWTVADSSIVKIENGDIIPLKVGETDVTTQIQSQDFKLHVTVIDVPSLWNNPKTGDKFFIILAVILIGFGIGTFIYKKKRV
jgi:surface protein